MNHYIFAGLNPNYQSNFLVKDMAEDNVKTIIRILAENMGVTYEDVISQSRYRELVTARHIIIYYLRDRFKKLSLKRIGMYLGGRDHTTVIYALKACSDYWKDPFFKKMWKAAMLETSAIPIKKRTPKLPLKQKEEIKVVYYGKYQVQVKKGGIRNRIGSYKTRAEAEIALENYKKEQLTNL